MNDDRTQDELSAVRQELTKVAAAIQLLSAKQDGMGQLIDERWKSMEARLDMTARQTQQSIDLLVAALTKLETSHKESSTEVDVLRGDMRVYKVEFEDLQKMVIDQRDNLRWMWRTLVGGALTLAVTVVAFFITQQPFHK